MTNTYTQKTWSLADLFPAADSRELKEAFKELETRAAALESKRPLLTNKISQKEFMDVISELERCIASGTAFPAMRNCCSLLTHRTRKRLD